MSNIRSARLRAATHRVAATFILAILLAPALNSTFASHYLPPKQVAKLVRAYFPNAPVMVRVAVCESGLQQTRPNGRLVRSDHDAVGVMQIHAPAHAKTAAAEGVNIRTIRGNLTWARKLFKERGLQPWIDSKGCWGNRARAEHMLQEVLNSSDD